MNFGNIFGCKHRLTFQIMRSLFVQNARSLERLKTVGIPQDVINNGKYMVFRKGSEVLLDSSTKTIAWQNTQGLANLGIFASELQKVLLDVVQQDPEICLFAVNLAENEAAKELSGIFYNGRAALFILDSTESSLVSQARGLLNFNATTIFCKTCGGKLKSSEGGTQKTCEGCQRTHYPTLSPVGIVLIENQLHSKVLLVRGSRHPPGMFSCVAGFIEPGESLEGNVRREIAEEVGLDVEEIQYCSSQHWAMPESQLMLGCIATAKSDDFDLDPTELESGQWVEANVLAEALLRSKQLASPKNPEDLWVPPATAVAHTLMEYWLTKFHNFSVPSSHI